MQFPEPTTPRATRADVLVEYLDFFRDRLRRNVAALTETQQRTSLVPSDWTPVQLVKHLTFVERRWLEWGFEGRDVGDPFGDSRDDRWYVDDTETWAQLEAALTAQGERTRRIVSAHELTDVGAPGPRWDDADPPALERVLLHLLQEYARHVGQLDIVVELAGGPTGE